MLLPPVGFSRPWQRVGFPEVDYNDIRTHNEAGAIEKDPSVIPKALQTVAMKKIATTEDVANSILFLASPAAGHISGCILDVNGGMEGRCLNPL